MEFLSSVLAIVVLGGLLFLTDRLALKRDEKIFKNRVAYILDELEKRNIELNK